MTDFKSPENPNSAAPGVPLPLKIAVYGMGAALIVMLILVIMRFMDRRAEKAAVAPDAGKPWIVEAQIGDNASVREVLSDGKLLTLVVSVPGEADRVLLVDPRKGRLVGEINLAP